MRLLLALHEPVGKHVRAKYKLNSSKNFEAKGHYDTLTQHKICWYMTLTSRSLSKMGEYSFKL